MKKSAPLDARSEWRATRSLTWSLDLSCERSTKDRTATFPGVGLNSTSLPSTSLRVNGIAGAPSLTFRKAAPVPGTVVKKIAVRTANTIRETRYVCLDIFPPLLFVLRGADAIVAQRLVAPDDAAAAVRRLRVRDGEHPGLAE